MIQQAISAILLPDFSTFCLGLSVSLIFFKACTRARIAEELNCCCLWMMAQNISGPEVSYPGSFLIVPQSSSMMEASTYFILQEILSQSKLQAGRQFIFLSPTPVVVRVWTHLKILPSSAAPQSSRRQTPVFKFLLQTRNTSSIPYVVPNPGDPTCKSDLALGFFQGKLLLVREAFRAVLHNGGSAAEVIRPPGLDGIHYRYG